MLNAQQIHKYPDVTHLKIYNSYLHPVIKKDSVFFNGNFDLNLVAVMDYKKSFNEKNIIDNYSILLPVRNIKPISRQDLLKSLVAKEFIIRKENGSYIQTIQIIKTGILIRTYKFEAKYSPIKIDSAWNIDDAWHAHIKFLEFNGGGLILYGGGYYIIPTENGLMFSPESVERHGRVLYLQDTVQHLTSVVGRSKNEYCVELESSLLQTCCYVDWQKFIKVVKINNGKYQVKNIDGEILIHELFDTVFMNNFYILGRKSKTYSVYNMNFDLIISPVRSFNFLVFHLQIIQDSCISTIGVLGQLKKYKEQYQGPYVCGTTGARTAYSFNLVEERGLFFVSCTARTNLYETRYRENNNSSNKVVKAKEYSDRNFKTAYKRLYPPLSAGSDKVDLLDKYYKPRKQVGIRQRESPGPDWFHNKNILVTKSNNKYGLTIYYAKPNYYNSKEWPYDSIIEKQILPVFYDSITYPGVYEPLRLFKDRYYSLLIPELPIDWYNDDSSSYKVSNPYLWAGQIDNYYIRYLKPNGEKGWLDLVRNEEFPDKADAKE